MKWRESASVIRFLSMCVDPDDGCMTCGYAYGYSLEGCDDCKPITDLLIAAGIATEEDR